MKRKLTSLLLILAMALALLPFGAATAEAVQSGKCGDNVTWKLEDGVLTVSGSGKMTDFTDENLPPWIESIEDVEKIVVGSGVTRIGNVAFILCANATSVSIPSTVTEIGEGAFSYCYALESITLPAGLKKIGPMAFFGCIGVTEMRVPASVTDIGTAAFSCCGAMTSFQVDSGNTRYSADGRALFNKDKTRLIEYCAQAHPTYTIPSTVKTVGSNSICGWLKMTRVTIPASVTRVEEDAFVSNTAMTTLVVDSGNPYYATDGKALMNKAKTKIVEFCAEGVKQYTAPASVTSLADYAFANCTALSSVSISKTGVTELSEGAFYGCTKLETVWLPTELTKVGDGAFYGCTNFCEFTMKKVQTIGAAAFAFTGNIITEKDLLLLPNTLSSIGENAFYGSGVEKIVFLGNMPTIGDNAFYGTNVIAYYPTLNTTWKGMEQYGGTISWRRVPVITSQPSDVTAAIGDTVEIKVKVEGDGLTYQWYMGTVSGFTTSYKVCRFPGAKTDTLKVPVTADMDGNKFYCVVKDQNYEFTETRHVTLTTKAGFTVQPKSVSAAVGDTAEFTVQATDENVTYQWQYYTGSKWANSSMTGAKTATLEVPVTAARNGQQYRCVITDANGNKTESNGAKLTVRTAITAQPADKTASVGDTAKFTVKATGAGLTYQWQYRTPTGTGWLKCSMEGNQTKMLSVPVTAGRNGYRYRCVITDANGKETYSDGAYLTVKTEITAQPADKTASVGDTAKFTVKAAGAGLTYQWQYRTPTGTGWLKCSMEGNQTKTLSVPVTAARNGYRYRCVITDANGKKTYSDGAYLTVKTKITAQPADKTASVGDTAKFTVKAAGAGLTYQWQYRTPTGTGWLKCSMEGNQTKTLSVPVTAARNGYRYRCVITDANGKKTYSDAAVLTVK